jgi:hypothetical protein
VIVVGKSFTKKHRGGEQRLAKFSEMTPASSSVRADSRSGGRRRRRRRRRGGGVAEAAPKGSATLTLKQRIGPGSYGVSALSSLYSPNLLEVGRCSRDLGVLRA